MRLPSGAGGYGAGMTEGKSMVPKAWDCLAWSFLIWTRSHQWGERQRDRQKELVPCTLRGSHSAHPKEVEKRGAAAGCPHTGAFAHLTVPPLECVVQFVSWNQVCLLDILLLKEVDLTHPRS